MIQGPHVQQDGCRAQKLEDRYSETLGTSIQSRIFDYTSKYTLLSGLRGGTDTTETHKTKMIKSKGRATNRTRRIIRGPYSNAHAQSRVGFQFYVQRYQVGLLCEEVGLKTVSYISGADERPGDRIIMADAVIAFCPSEVHYRHYHISLNTKWCSECAARMYSCVGYVGGAD